MSTPTHPGWWLRASAGEDAVIINNDVENVFERDGQFWFYNRLANLEPVGDHAWLGEMELLAAKEPDHETFPFEVTRGGFRWGTTREISDDQVMAMFVVDGVSAPFHWCDQELPAMGSCLMAAAIGLEGELIDVTEHLWHASNFVSIVCEQREKSE